MSGVHETADRLAGYFPDRRLPMESKLLHEHSGQRTFAIVLKTGEEVFGSLSDFAKREGISAAQLTAIGALSDVELKYFDWEKKKYETVPVREQVEVASLIGDVAVFARGRAGAARAHRRRPA
jgi:uncharacterized protein